MKQLTTTDFKNWLFQSLQSKKERRPSHQRCQSSTGHLPKEQRQEVETQEDEEQASNCKHNVYN